MALNLSASIMMTAVLSLWRARSRMGAGGVRVAAQQAGERVAAGGGEALVQGGGVDRPAGERYGGGDQEGARADPGR